MVMKPTLESSQHYNDGFMKNPPDHPAEQHRIGANPDCPNKIKPKDIICVPTCGMCMYYKRDVNMNDNVRICEGPDWLDSHGGKSARSKLCG